MTWSLSLKLSGACNLLVGFSDKLLLSHQTFYILKDFSGNNRCESKGKFLVIEFLFQQNVREGDSFELRALAGAAEIEICSFIDSFSIH